MDFFYIDIYGENGKPVGFVSTISNSQTGEVLSTYLGDGKNQQVKIYTAGYPLESYTIKIEAKGYKTFAARLDQLQDTSIFLKKAQLPALQLAMAAGLIYYGTKQKKKVAAITADQVRPFLLIGGAVIAFDTVKKIFEGIGFWNSPDSKDLDNQSINPNSFWNPNFWRTIKPPDANWTYAIDTTTALKWIDDLQNAFGPFNDNEEQAIAVLKRCRTQANLSFLADIFNRYKGQDLLTYLRGGWWPQDRLSDADVNSISNYISRLPKY